MAPRFWATDEQLPWLQSRVASFLQRRTEKKLLLFWPGLFRDWFEKWPIEDVMPIPTEGEALEKYQKGRKESIEQCQRRLKEWFYNNGTAKSKSRGNHSAALKSLHIRKPRCPQVIELYSRKYYSERLKEKVRKEIKDLGLPQKETLKLIKQRTLEAFEAEPEELKASIIAEANAAKEKAKEAAKQGTSDSETSHTPESYQAAIEALPSYLKAFFAEIRDKTGWVFTVLAGGPVPINGGKIRTFGYDSGKNEIGLSFSDAHPSFQLTYLKPFSAFVKQVFPPEVRAARALHKDDDEDDDDEDEPPLPIDINVLRAPTTLDEPDPPSSPSPDLPGFPTSPDLDPPSSPSPDLPGFPTSPDLDPLIACASGPGDGGSSVHSRLEARSSLNDILPVVAPIHLPEAGVASSATPPAPTDLSPTREAHSTSLPQASPATVAPDGSVDTTHGAPAVTPLPAPSTDPLRRSPVPATAPASPDASAVSPGAVPVVSAATSVGQSSASTVAPDAPAAFISPGAAPAVTAVTCPEPTSVPTVAPVAPAGRELAPSAAPGPLVAVPSENSPPSPVGSSLASPSRTLPGGDENSSACHGSLAPNATGSRSNKRRASSPASSPDPKRGKKSRAPAKPPAAKRSRKTVDADIPLARAQRVRKAPATKEVIPLTAGRG